MLRIDDERNAVKRQKMSKRKKERKERDKRKKTPNVG
jgi:hypothetical protein